MSEKSCPGVVELVELARNMELAIGARMAWLEEKREPNGAEEYIILQRAVPHAAELTYELLMLELLTEEGVSA